MKPIDPSYVPPETTFDQFPDGKYKVKGFEWFTKDEKDRPILVAQKDGKLVGRLRFNLSTGEEGPPMSCTLADMNLLVKAFGVTKLPNLPDESYAAMVTKYMVDIRNLCADKELEVEVKKGWVNDIPGSGVPEGTYWFYISDVSSPEKNEKGEPKPKLGDYGFFFFVTFTVDSEKGHDSPYKGATFTELVPYGIVVNDNGEAEFEKIKEGKYAGQNTGPATLLNKLMILGAPDTFGTEFTPPNPHNLLPFMKQKFLEARQMLEGQRVLIEKKVKGKQTSRIGLSWPGVKKVEGYEAPKRLIEEMNIDDQCRQVLMEALTKLAEGKPVVMNGSFEFTDAGRAVAKKYLSPIRQEGLIEHGHPEELTPEEIVTILTTLQDKVGAEFKEKVVMLSVGFSPQPIEEDDSPF